MSRPRGLKSVSLYQSARQSTYLSSFPFEALSAVSDCQHVMFVKCEIERDVQLQWHCPYMSVYKQGQFGRMKGKAKGVSYSLF